MDPNNQPQQPNEPTDQYGASPNPSSGSEPSVPQQPPAPQPNMQENVAPSDASVPTAQTGTSAPSGENPGQTLGIVGLVLAFFFAPAAIVLGVISRNKSKASGHPTTLGTIAMVLGIVFTVLITLFTILYVMLIVSAVSNYDESNPETLDNDSSLFE